MSWIPSYKKPNGGGGYIPCSWSDGTDEEITEALEKHYAGEIDLHDYWSVGDERVISLSEVSNVYGTLLPQNGTFVLMNAGGKELTTSINGYTECAFVVGLKDVLLKPSASDPKALGIPMNVFPWAGSGYNALRTWLNDENVFLNAFPASLKSIFKQCKNIYLTDTTNDTTGVSNDYFAVPSEKEVYGESSYNQASSIGEANMSQFEYYKTTANLSKSYNPGNSGYEVQYWWTRSPASKHNNYGYGDYVLVDTNSVNGRGYGGSSYSSKYAVSPFGVI